MREISRRKRSAASPADTLCRLDSKPAARPKRGRHAREERERRKILTTSSEPRERLFDAQTISVAAAGVPSAD